jgi:hypothetical protein
VLPGTRCYVLLLPTAANHYSVSASASAAWDTSCCSIA